MKHERTPVEQAAYEWWLSKRPAGYDQRDHLDNPTVNCDRWNKKLAEAVAEMIISESYS